MNADGNATLAGEGGAAQTLGWTWPDYDGGGAANLMASLLAALAPERHAVCGELATSNLLSPQRIAAARHVVLLVVDGLGSHQLTQHAPSGLLSQSCIGEMSAVFPSTTSSAITTYMTGHPPVAHGLTGWHTWLPALGVIGTPLPYTVRASGASIADTGVRAEDLFSGLGMFDAMRCKTHLIHPHHLVDSHYSRAHGGHAQMCGFKGLDGLCAQIQRVARGGEPDFSYAYWPELDARSHVHGSLSASALRHLLDIERHLERLWSRIEGSGTLLLVSSDHGFVDTTPATHRALVDHPDFARCLLMPLSGEPRTVFCHLRPGAQRDALDYVGEHLADVCEARSSAQLLASGAFGPPRLAHPELGARIGDLTLLMKHSYVLTDRLPRESPFAQVGVHGGLSAAEMRIPLIALGP